jgi:hypothetical protein
MGTHPRASRWRRRTFLLVVAGLALYAIAGIPIERWRALLPSSSALGPTHVVVRAFDVVATPRQEVLLRAKVQKQDALGLYPAVPGVRVVFELGGDQVAQSRTGVDGTATADWIPPSASEYTLTARVDSASSFVGDPALLFVGIYDDDDCFVAVDFDGTLTKSPGLTLPFEDAKPPLPQVGAAEVLTEIAKSFHVLYVTSRDERSMESVKSWLRKHGFPDGVTFFREYELLEAPAEDFRYHELRRLRAIYSHIQYGVGDEPADARAYARAGVSPIVLGESSDSALPPNTRIAPSWAEVRRSILER